MNIIKAYAFRFAMLFVNGLTVPYLCYSKFGCFFMPIFHMLASGSLAYNFWGVPSSLEMHNANAMHNNSNSILNVLHSTL